MAQQILHGSIPWVGTGGHPHSMLHLHRPQLPAIRCQAGLLACGSPAYLQGCPSRADSAASAAAHGATRLNASRSMTSLPWTCPGWRL